MVKFRFLIICVLCLHVLTSTAQEQLAGLASNREVAGAWNMLPQLKSKGVTDTINIPFFEDFTNAGVYADTARWIDRDIFVNNTFSENQISRGFATFDAIDQAGELYDFPAGTSFTADNLTSRYINLFYPASDSVYLSFHYQPQGLGDKPETGDSITLQFWAPAEAAWYSVWKMPGTSLHPFTAVNIPITDPKFLAKGFRFRFRNYASFSSNTDDPTLIGNCDHWNIDYIKVDRNRNKADTLYRDVAFTRPLRSMLKSHEAMPWPQFKKVFLAEMGPFITVNYRNNDAITRNITRDFLITDLHKNIIAHSFSGGAVNISAATNEIYNANAFYTFNTDNPDSALFRITASLKTDPFDLAFNDTIKYLQVFSDYFSFDDGSIEMGYGINGQGAQNAMVAYRFKSFLPDSLRAIRIAFNESLNELNFRSFDLMVWADNNGKPGNILYVQEEVMVAQGPGINGFRQYILDTPVAVNDLFWIGWQQRSDAFLNAGVDRNSTHGGKHMYWLNGIWNISQIQGALMIRAVTGPSLTSVSIENEETYPVIPLKMWPNPVSDLLNIEIDLHEVSRIVIVDLSGRIVKETNDNMTIDVSGLSPGVYITLVYHRDRVAAKGKFIKTSKR